MSRNSDREKLKNKVTKASGTGSQSSIKESVKKKTTSSLVSTTPAKNTTTTKTTPATKSTTTVKSTASGKTTPSTKSTTPSWVDTTPAKSTTSEKSAPVTKVGDTIPGTTTPSISGAQKSAWNDFAQSGRGNGTGKVSGGSSGGSTTPSWVDTTKPSTPSGSNAVADEVKNIINNAASDRSGSTSSGGNTLRSGSGYDNGGLSAAQIRELQAYYGTDADGMWGSNSMSAAGGLGAREAWGAYQAALQERELENLRNSLQQTVGQGTQTGGQDTPTGGQGTQTGGTETDLGSDLTWEEYLKLAGRDDYEQKIRDAVAAQVQQAIDSYNKQIEQAAGSYEDAARRAYISSMLSRRNMDQELAASGVYGGMADSQRIALEADYQNGLTDLESQYSDTVAQIRQAITSAQLAGDAQGAEQMANYLSQLQSQYAQYLAQREQERATARLTAQEAAYNSQLAAQEAAYNIELAAQKASGKSGTSSGGTYGGSGNVGGETAYGQGLTNYGDVKRTIMLTAAQGSADRANNLIRQYWSQMSAAQQSELVSALRSQGWSV